MSDYSFHWGTTYPIDIAVTLNGSAVSLSGKKLILTAKRRKSDVDADAVFQLSTETGQGITVTDAPGGLARATITPAHTEDLPAGRETRLYHDVKLIDGSNLYVLTEGTLCVLSVVTRATS